MIHVRRGQQQTLVGCLKPGNTVMENPQHFLPIAGITAVYAKKFSMAFHHRSIAAAGRLNQNNLGIVCDHMGGDSGNKLLTFRLAQKLCKLADAVEGSVGRESLFIQRLHGQIDVNQQLTAYISGKSIVWESPMT